MFVVEGCAAEQLNVLRGYFDRREMVPEAINERCHQLVREYIVVGGLPEVVCDFIENGHYGRVQDLQEKILSDVGLLCAYYGMLVKKQILDGTLKGPVKGGVYENFLASVLKRNGYSLRYYRNDAVEMEFLLEGDDGVIPLECKSKSGRTLSLDALLRDEAIPYGYKFTGGNVGVVGKKITLPHYLALFV